jgi:hypothetical protein
VLTEKNLLVEFPSTHSRFHPRFLGTSNSNAQYNNLIKTHVLSEFQSITSSLGTVQGEDLPDKDEQLFNNITSAICSAFKNSREKKNTLEKMQIQLKNAQKYIGMRPHFEACKLQFV